MHEFLSETDYNALTDSAEKAKYTSFNVNIKANDIITQTQYDALTDSEKNAYNKVQVGYIDDIKFYSATDTPKTTSSKYIIVDDKLNSTSAMYFEADRAKSVIPVLLTQAVVTEPSGTQTYHASRRWALKQTDNGTAITTGQTENSSANLNAADSALYTSFETYSAQLQYVKTADEKYSFTANVASNLPGVVTEIKWLTKDDTDNWVDLTGGTITGDNAVQTVTLDALPASGAVSYIATYKVAGIKVLELHSADVTFDLAIITTEIAPSNNLDIPEYTTSYDVLDENRVDNSSNMWEAFMGDPRDTVRDEIMSRPNVMSVSEVEELNAVENSEGLSFYLNLSKPQMNFTTQPIEYGSTEHFDYLGVSPTTDITVLLSQDLVTGDSNTLIYEFELTNPTDPTPVDTKYYTNLYNDIDGNGRFSTTESLSDLVVYEKLDDGLGNISYLKIDENQLSAGKTYKVDRSLPDSVVGAVTWKLEIVKVGAETITASHTGITYNKPDQITENKSFANISK